MEEADALGKKLMDVVYSMQEPHLSRYLISIARMTDGCRAGDMLFVGCSLWAVR